MKTVLFTKPIVRILIVLAAVGGLALVVWLRSGLPQPDEANRVGPLDGSFSIIKPPGWEEQITYAPADPAYITTIDIRPARSIGQHERLFVARMREQPDLEKRNASGILESDFQGRPAFMGYGKRSRDFWWSVWFRIGTDWYEITVRTNIPQDIPASDWWAYVASFKAREPSPTPTSGINQ